MYMHRVRTYPSPRQSEGRQGRKGTRSTTRQGTRHNHLCATAPVSARLKSWICGLMSTTSEYKIFWNKLFTCRPSSGVGGARARRAGRFVVCLRACTRLEKEFHSRCLLRIAAVCSDVAPVRSRRTPKLWSWAAPAPPTSQPPSSHRPVHQLRNQPQASLPRVALGKLCSPMVVGVGSSA